MVAVKLALEAGEGTQELVHEAALMAQVGHENLVALVGVVSSGLPLLLVLDYCDNGSLLSALKQRRQGRGPLFLTNQSTLPKSDVQLATDVARGMESLSDSNFVHRCVSKKAVRALGHGWVLSALAAHNLAQTHHPRSRLGLVRNLNLHSFQRLGSKKCAPQCGSKLQGG